MIIKKYNSNALLLLPLLVMMLVAVPMRGEKKSIWKRLTPNVATMQYAGNIGKVSAGVGWEYGKDKWLTEALLGYVPRHFHTQSLNTFTLRQYYTPWSITLPFIKSDRGAVKICPIAAGMFVNVVLFDGDFWTQEPKSNYGGSYYRFSTRVRFSFSLGQRLIYEFPKQWKRCGEGVELFYDFSANELGIISAIPNDCIDMRDILSLGFGARWKF
jgi:hypothetical protein